MSFLAGNTAKKPRPKQKLLGLDELKGPTNEQARPIPYLAGTQRGGVTFLSEAIGFRTVPIGKTKKGGGTQHDYFASFATALCHGQLGTLRELWFDDERVWEGPLSYLATDSDPITVDEWGSATLYWGRMTQTADPILTGSGNAHPPYRGLAYIVWDQFAFGTNRTTPPAIEWVASRAPVVPGGFPVSVWIGTDINPMAAVYELLVNPRFGLGVLESRLDLVSLYAVATQLNTEGFGMSISLTRAVSMRQTLAEIFEYFDGWYRVRADGKITFGLIRSATLTGVPEWDEQGLVDDPQLMPGSWSDTASHAQVTFTDATRYWKENSVGSPDQANATITQEVKSPVYDRPWITQPALAGKAAQVIAQRHGKPEGKLVRRMRRSIIGTSAPGDVVKVSHAHHSQVSVPARIESIAYGPPGDPTAEVDLLLEVGDLNEVFANPVAPTAPPVVTYSAVVAVYEQVVELPLPLAGQDDHPVVSMLVARPTTATDRFFGHVRQVDLSYEPVPDTSTPNFAIRCHTLAAVPASTFTVWSSPGLEIELDGVDEDLTRFSVGDYAGSKVLALVGTELMVVQSATLTGAGQYRCAVERGGHFTTPAAASSGDQVWVFHADLLFTHDVEAPGASTQVYKMQPSVLGRKVGLSSCVARSISVDRARLGPPPPANLRAWGDRLNPTWSGSTDIVLEWDPVNVFGPTWWNRWGSGYTSALEVQLEFRNAGGTVVATIPLAAGTLSYTWTYAAATTALGAAVDFTVRAKHRSGSLYSQTPTILSVTRI